MFALDTFRLQPTNIAQMKRKKSPRRKKGYFLKGPIPARWISIAGNLPGKTLHVAICLWHAYGIERRDRFKFTSKWHSWFNISPPTLRESLRRLEKAHLIRLEHRPGCAPIVTILDAPEESAS